MASLYSHLRFFKDVCKAKELDGNLQKKLGILLKHDGERNM